MKSKVLQENATRNKDNNRAIEQFPFPFQTQQSTTKQQKNCVTKHLMSIAMQKMKQIHTQMEKKQELKASLEVTEA